MYAGNTIGSEIDTSYKTVNVLCHEGIMEGFLDCGMSLSAQYIIITVTVNDYKLNLAELLAWDVPIILVDKTSLTL